MMVTKEAHACGLTVNLRSYLNKVSFIPNTMLEYCKTILQKISFSKSLFKKEYRKSFKYLSEGERLELKRWLKVNVLKVPTREALNATPNLK